jgi:hypothetical protein
MTNEMPTWWFAGSLAGAMSLANDETASNIVRETMRKELADLLENWLIDDKVCRRTSLYTFISNCNKVNGSAKGGDATRRNSGQ